MGCGSSQSIVDPFPRSDSDGCIIASRIEDISKPSKNFPDLRSHNNQMSRSLDRKIYENLFTKKTRSGFTIDKAIQTGVDNPGGTSPLSEVGCVAGDEESYELFSDLFLPLISGRHNGYNSNSEQLTDLEATKICGGDLDSDYVLSCHVRTGRNIRSFSLPPHCTREERRKVEKIVSTVLSCLPEEFQGKYYPLKDISERDQIQMIDNNILFEKPVSPLLLASRIARDWPDARGVWYNEEKELIIWVNEEDHVQIISLQQGGNLLDVFAKFCKCVKSFGAELHNQGNNFMWNKNLGYLMTCPSKLGTGLIVGVRIKLPNLYRAPLFQEILYSLGLQMGCKVGFDKVLSGDDLTILSSDRIGLTEVQIVQKLIDGVKLLIQMEKRLECHAWIHDLLPKSLMSQDPIPDYPKLNFHYNYMSIYLTPSIYLALKMKTTRNGFTIDQAIQTGVDNPGNPYFVTIGCVAGDEESYQNFSKLFDPIIEIRHNGYKKDAIHKTDLFPDNLIGGEHLDTEYVLSCCISTARNICGYSLAPHCSREERRNVERIIIDAISQLPHEYSGKYYPLKEISTEDQRQMIMDNILFDKPVSSLLLSSRISRDWPDARGVWLNDSKNLLFWVNEEDHVRVMSMQHGSNIHQVFTNFCDILKKFEELLNERKHSVMWNEHLGYIMTCLSNLGTGLLACVRIKLPKLSQQSDFLNILQSLRLQKRETGAVDHESKEEVFEISNLDRLGFSEVQLTQIVINGIALLVKMEKALEIGKSITEMVP